MGLLALALTSCNTSEALTPQIDIGGGRSSRASTPVTQADTDRMAQSQPRQPYVERQSGYAGNPQNTLEAQARALESGGASPASSGPPPQWNGQGATQETASLPEAMSQSGATIRFLPIIGAPVQAVTPLSRQLGAQARSSGLTIRPSSDTSTQHILKGYFSAFADGDKVTIVYVWDILDGAGTRLHRMQGQENVPARGSDPWAAVPSSTMEGIATKTIRDYVSWQAAQAG